MKTKNNSFHIEFEIVQFENYRTHSHFIFQENLVSMLNVDASRQNFK